MSNKVFKNYQVNVGIPFQVKPHINFQTIKTVPLEDTVDLGETLHQPAVDTTEIIMKAREEAEMIIKEAHYEAERIMQEAEMSANSRAMEVEEAARQAGYNDGLEAATQQYNDLINEAEFIKEQAKVEYNKVLQGIEADAVDMILEIARTVIGVELSFNSEDVLYLVKQAFEKCGNKENVILKVSPADYEYIAANKDRLLSMIEGLGELELKSDPSLKAGGCIVETQYGSIDAGVETKLKKIEEAFRAAIGK